jgi:chromosome segregation protein
MLLALEMVGFKSFADKTRFEFGRGISVVVGPNGSGKSNVVDALKWVLGETSVKSLRGKEMTDVIFNGSSSRHPLHTAEATLLFDNQGGWLPIEAPQVRLTRRVYRSGEGEYFINQQACRRRDIRDLLAGTGLGGGGYSIIEQGRVDAMLQASPRDRRQIFEEAAGTSRFRVKKQETERRLERVEQNLLRLKDIVDEVESRLRSVRLQAGKARKHREYAERLQELRTQAGLVDWRKFARRLAALDEEIDTLRCEAAQRVEQAATCQRQHQELETLLVELDRAQQERDSGAARVRERIAACDAAIAHEQSRMREIEDELPRLVQELLALNVQAGDLHEQQTETAALLDQAQQAHAVIDGRVTTDEDALAELSRRLAEIRAANEARRGQYLERLRASAALGGEIGLVDAKINECQQARERSRQHLAELHAARAQATQAQSALEQEQRQTAEALEARRGEARRAQEELNASRLELQRHTEELAALREQLTAARERAAILADLERRQEGLSAGSKEVLRRAAESPDGPLSQVLGLVADVFQVNVEAAALIEIALGEAVGHLIIEPREELLDELERLSLQLEGRAGFVPVAPKIEKGAEFDEGNALPSSLFPDRRRGVIGRADLFVETPPQFRDLARRLLGGTWIVESLADARRLHDEGAEQHPAAALHFVTLAGERLAADGTLTIGTPLGAAGLIARRSELRELHARLEELTTQVHDGETARADWARRIQAGEETLQRRSDECRVSEDQLAELRRQNEALLQRLHQLAREAAIADAEICAAQERIAAARTERETAVRRQSALDAELAEAEKLIAAAAREVIQLDQRRQDVLTSVTAAKIERAQSHERVAALALRLKQCRQDEDERRRSMDEQRGRLRECRERALASARRILTAETDAALLYTQHESLTAAALELEERRQDHRRQRSEAARLAQQLSSEARRLEEQLHAQELAANEVRMQMRTLADRLREDYGIELTTTTEAAASGTTNEDDELSGGDDAGQRDAADREIEDLRAKLARLGHVNLDALDELDELEARFEKLNAQYQDLSSAKNSLVQIIHRINADSRRMFSETLETVRGHFAALFRKLFGGGQADIVLEEGVDPLEGGVDINARPPGKELRNISLLSGGEKTLTCVALLLAIFRSRPSPFCVLDEVDAALDEANIGRFTGVLEDFTAETQFVVVTHSKKTMTCANTLYGVTMQESGVSKRVSVRFEDVSDDGQISLAAGGDEEETQAA